MLELTVKTLDSQNHSFTLSDEATVLNLKESILEKMEVPIISQRLIFHGKVLQDQKKLTEYGDVDGKVIHLVQRAPPSSSRPSDGSSHRRADSGPDAGAGGRRFMRHDTNTTYLGSMAIPAFPVFGPDYLDNMMAGMELPTRPSQVMARNRLDCAKRMMGFARQSIRQMAEPDASQQPSHSGRQQRRQTPSRSAASTATAVPPTEDRGTSTSSAPPPPEGAPVIPALARITAAQDALHAAVAQAIAGNASPFTILRGANGAEGPAGAAFIAEASGPAAAENVNFDDHHQDVAVEVEIESSDVTAEGRSEPEANIRDNSAENRPGPRYEEGARVDSMVPLLSDLESLNTDLQPFLARCRDLLSADNSFDDDSSPSYQEAVRVFGGVSETLHSISHACHALSDLMVDFDEDAPRSLRCRPVVLQHSTILETGFPIRLTPADMEAQINVRRVDVGGTSPSGSDASLTPPVADPPRSASATAEPGAARTTGESQGGLTSVQVGRFEINGPGGLPGDLEIYMDFGLSPDHGSMDPLIDTPPTESAPPTAARPDSASTPRSASSAGPTATATRVGALSGGGFSITNFPSVNATGTFVPTPGQLNNLHSSLQVIAGQIRNQLMGQVNPDGTPSQPSPAVVAAAAALASAASARPTALSGELPPRATSTPRLTPEGGASERPEFPAAPAAAAAAAAGTTASTGTTTQAPEQAAAGSQTTPPRRTGAMPGPVADMLHSLFQGSFDPALPCNSHHIRGTRQRASQTIRPRTDMFPSGGAFGVIPPSGAPPQMGPRRAPRLISGRLVAEPLPPPPPLTQAPAAAQRPGAGSRNILLDFLGGPPFATGGMSGRPGNANDPNVTTAADFFDNLFGIPIEGQSIVTDLILTLARNMTWTDLINLMGARNGDLESVLGRLRPVLQDFATQRVLQGEAPSEESIKRACDRIFNELRPYIEAIEETPLLDSVDLSATINNYNLAQLPEMIALIVETGTNVNFGAMLIRRLTVYARELTAIIMHCCVDVERFDTIVRSCVRQLTRGVPEALQQWTEFHSVSNLHYLTTGLNVPLEDIQGYLVYRIPGAAAPAPAAPPAQQEPMETDGVWAASAALPLAEKPEEAAAEALVAMDTENLPDVLIGSETWHEALPTEWVPVIARDSQRQRRQSSQKPFSDAYLTGMPPKRRKLIAAAKPQGESLSQTISEGVRHAIQAAGVSSPLAERAITEAGRDPVLQQAYKEQEKAAAGPGLNDDPDFKASRFPNAHKFFNK